MPYSRYFAQRRQCTINWHIPSEDPPDRFKARSTRFLRILRAFWTRRNSRRFSHQFVDRSLELPVRHMSAKTSFRGAPGSANISPSGNLEEKSRSCEDAHRLGERRVLPEGLGSEVKISMQCPVTTRLKILPIPKKGGEISILIRQSKLAMNVLCDSKLLQFLPHLRQVACHGRLGLGLRLELGHLRLVELLRLDLPARAGDLPQSRRAALPPTVPSQPAATHFAIFWRARSPLYRNQRLQVNMRLTALLKHYKICTLLHRAKLNILAKNLLGRP